MKNRFKINDYLFIVVSVISVIILASGVFLIDYVLNLAPETNAEDDVEFPNNIGYEDEINLLDEDEYYKKYYISVQDENFSAEIEEMTIDISEDSISVNDVMIVSGAYPTKYLSFYGDYLIMPFIYTDNWYGGIVIYNTVDGNNEIIDRIGNKYIINDMESFNSSKEGIILNTSIVNEDKLYIDTKEEKLCDIYKSKKSKKMKVIEDIFLKYNKKKGKVITNKYDKISNLNLESYVLSSDLCK